MVNFWQGKSLPRRVKRGATSIAAFAFALLATLATARGNADETLQWLTWDGSQEGTPPEVRVIESDANHTTFEIVVHGFFMENIEKETSWGTINFGRIFLPRDPMSNYGTMTNVGSAELPLIRRYIAVLSDAEKAVAGPGCYEIDESAVSTIENIMVYPFQAFSSEQYPRLKFNFEEKFYEAVVHYPFDYKSPSLMTFRVGGFHNLRVARVEIYPFVYITLERALKIYRHFKVRVEHAGQPLSELPSVSITYERMYEGLVANYELIKPVLSPLRREECGAYLIIVPDEYYMEVLPLTWWKRAKGLSVATRTIPSQVPNDVDEIRTAIRNFYEEHASGDVFVLLVGDVEEVASPPYPGHEWGLPTENCSSDIKYAMVSGEDTIPDLFVGRLPADNAQDVDNVIKKTLDYERMSSGEDKTWLGKALLVAHKQDYPGKYTACKESIRLYPYSFAMPTFDTVYGGAGAANSAIGNALREGRGIVNYRGQGGADCWWMWGAAGQSWCIVPDVINLTNAEKTPIIFSAASLDNHIKSDDSLGEEFLELPGGGAVAYYGASADAGSVANDYLDKNLFKAAFDEGIHALGAAVNWAQIRTMEELPGTGPFSAEYNSRIYVLLGDPEMSIRTRPPLSFGTVEYPEWVQAGEQSVEVAVRGQEGEPVRDALITVRKYKGASASPDVEARGYTDDEGKVAFAISPTSRGGLSVTVLKQNYVPFYGDGTLGVIHAERDAVTGSFSFSWQAEPGRNYAVYVWDDLRQEAGWRLLGLSPKRDGLTITVTDTTAGLAKARFYKVQAQ